MLREDSSVAIANRPLLQEQRTRALSRERLHALFLEVSDLLRASLHARTTALDAEHVRVTFEPLDNGITLQVVSLIEVHDVPPLRVIGFYGPRQVLVLQLQLYLV